MIRGTFEIVIGTREFLVCTGDITKVQTDAVGNAANSQLAGGGGVDAAIHRGGGPSIMRELDTIRSRIGSLPAGDAVATKAGRLPAQWVLHAVGPVYRDGRHGEAGTLASCYRKCLALSDELGAKSLTLPAISTGVYGYPLEDAADIAVATVAEALACGRTSLQRVTFVLFGDSAFRVFVRSSLEIVPRFA